MKKFKTHTLDEGNLENAKHAVNGLPEKAFCVVCGELEIKDRKIIHPELDKILAKILKNGFKRQYAK